MLISNLVATLNSSMISAKHIVLVLLLCGGLCCAQDEDYKSILLQMDSLRNSDLNYGHQKLDTERTFFLKIDSLMTVVYNDLSKSCKLKSIENEQRDWLLFFESESAKIWEPILHPKDAASALGRDFRMIAYSRQSDLVYDRVLKLIDHF